MFIGHQVLSTELHVGDSKPVKSFIFILKKLTTWRILLTSTHPIRPLQSIQPFFSVHVLDFVFYLLFLCLVYSLKWPASRTSSHKM